MIWGLGLLFALVFGPPLFMHWRRYSMTNTVRMKAPGQIASLPGGVTHYDWAGSESGPVAVCIHGMTTPSYVWAAIVRGLTTMGYRVLTYDLYGRGFSDRPPGNQSKAYFLAQLNELLADQGVEDIDLLIGYSMGGSLATFLAEEQPDRVMRMVLLASAGLGQSQGRLGEIVRTTPWLGDWIMQVFGGYYFGRSLAAQVVAAKISPQMADWQSAESHRRGFLQAVLSSQRHMLMEETQAAHRLLAKAGLPVLAIWAEEDEAISKSAMGRLAEVNRNARQDVVPGAGHALPYSHPREVLRAIQAFLREI